jgi:hypothetical protein
LLHTLYNGSQVDPKCDLRANDPTPRGAAMMIHLSHPRWATVAGGWQFLQHAKLFLTLMELSVALLYSNPTPALSISWQGSCEYVTIVTTTTATKLLSYVSLR